MSGGRDGADLVLETARTASIDVCFANPGTTEMHLVAALDRNPDIRPVLGLFEGVVTGAADGYGRMAGRPALTLLHLGPGLANGLANLHNARRAHSPVLNLVGDHATWHRGADAPLASDIETLAGTVGRCRVPSGIAGLAATTAAAIADALGPPAGPATLVLPQDLTWAATEVAPVAVDAAVPPTLDPDVVVTAAAALRRPRAALLVGGDALRRPGVEAVDRLAAATGCAVWAETFSARAARGGGLPAVPTIPYFPEVAVDALADIEVAVLVGCAEPVAFFGYPDTPSWLLPPACEVMRLRGAGEPTLDLLDGLVAEVGAPPFRPRDVSCPSRVEGELTTKSLGAALAATQPDGAIVVNEAATSGNPWTGWSATGAAHDVLGLTGGAIGQGLPCAVGAAVACPDRPVVAFQADGSGLYTAQALWTMAREALDITVVICANRAYRILQVELHRSGAEGGQASRSLMDLGDPAVDWRGLGRSLGVPATTVDTAEALTSALDRAFAEPGPHLVEALL